LLDPAGLYVGVLMQDDEKLYRNIEFYEIGTGRKAISLSRLEEIENPNAMSFS